MKALQPDTQSEAWFVVRDSWLEKPNPHDYPILRSTIHEPRATGFDRGRS